jgi:hypothetical protein
MKSYPWKWLTNRQVCPCEMCAEWRFQQDLERAIRAVNNYPIKEE